MPAALFNSKQFVQFMDCGTVFTFSDTLCGCNCVYEPYDNAKTILQTDQFEQYIQTYSKEFEPQLPKQRQLMLSLIDKYQPQ